MKRLKRLCIGVAIGLALLAGIIWLLSQTLGEREALYDGKPVGFWIEQSKTFNLALSNQANLVLTLQIIPQLTEIIYHDTNDSKLRMELIEALNGLPGVYIQFTPAGGRRSMAATYLGEFGPSAAAGIPALTHALKEGHDGNAATSLGKIHGQPEVIIPLLMTYLDDEDLADEMAEALGNFGPLAKAAVPKLLPLLKARDRDTRQAAIVALKQIDPEALTNALAAAQDRPKPAK